MSEQARLLPCAVKGCPWRGEDPHACPLHADDGTAWERQAALLPFHVVSRQQTRRRA